MKPDTGGLGPVEVKRLDGFLDIRPQLLPGVALGEDAFGETLRAIATIGFLRDLEYDFVHNLQSKRLHNIEQAEQKGTDDSVPNPHCSIRPERTAWTERSVPFFPLRTPKLLDANALLAFAARALSSRALTSAELREKLRRRAASPSDVDTILTRLKESGYLNDARFAEMFASLKRDNDGFGKTRVVRDLMNRRVAPSLAIKASEAAFAETDEIELIENFLARKCRGKNRAEEKHLASAFRKLRQAGFSAANSIRVLKRHAAQADQLEDIDEPEPEA